jgi:hypothetical protein
MTEILIQAVFLKSISATKQITGTSGAIFQDFRGAKERGQVAAHRALFALKMDGRNIADVAFNPNRPKLRRALIAPQARTDMLFPPENYADRLVEIVGTRPVLDVFQLSVTYQKPGKTEKSMVLDASFRLKQAVLRAHDDAIQRSEDILRGRGFERFDAKKLLIFSGPSSDIVRDDIEFSLLEAGPSQFLDFTIIYLGTSRAIIEKTQPALDLATLEGTLESLERFITEPYTQPTEGKVR